MSPLKRKFSTDLEDIPGVGPNMARDLRNLGVGCAEDLRCIDPEELYRALSRKYGKPQDRCVLYTFRCAVYYAEGGREPGKLKWWAWKDRI